MTKFSAFAFNDTAITKDDVKPMFEAEIEARKQKVWETKIEIEVWKYL